MVKRNSRIQNKRPRRYHGQPEAENLLNWLNLTEDLVGRARIIEVILAFLDATYLERLSQPKKRAERPRIYPVPPPLEVVDAAKRKLERLLSFYKVVPDIVLYSADASHDASFTIGYRAVPGSKLWKHLLAVGRDKPEEMTGELGALFDTLKLIDSGLIVRINPCRCGNFYFCKFSHQRFCSEACKLAEFRTSEEVRVRRNEYARNLYHLRKTGKVK